MRPHRIEVLAQFQEKDALVTVRKRDDATEVLFDGRIILASDAHETEEAFGKLAGTLVGTAARVPVGDLGPRGLVGDLGPRVLVGDLGPRVLVGGLGFGYTVRGALDALGPEARIVVAERVPRIVALCREMLAPLARDPLADPRVEVVECAVQDALATRGPFDVVLLDVDNGPDWATFRDNAWLYSDAGVRACSSALTPNGQLAVWSGYPAQAFLQILRRTGLEARDIPLHTKGGRVRARAYVGRRRGGA